MAVMELDLEMLLDADGIRKIVFMSVSCFDYFSAFGSNAKLLIIELKVYAMKVI